MTTTDIQRGVTKFDATVPVQYYEFAPLAVKSEDDERSAFVREMVAPGANDAEWATFVGVCNAFRLNPLMNPRPVWCIERRENVNGEWKTTHPPQLGIAAYRIFAARSGEYGGGTETQWCGDDGLWRSVWIPTIRVDARGNRQPVYPTAARVGVWRTGFREPQWGVALWSEYAEYKKDGTPRSLWAKYPAFMLAKCAEKQALVKAFPEQIPEAKVGRYFSISEAPERQTTYRPALSEHQAAGAGLLYPQDEPEEGDYQDAPPEPEPEPVTKQRTPASTSDKPDVLWAAVREWKAAGSITDAELIKVFAGPPAKWVANGRTWLLAHDELAAYIEGKREAPEPDPRGEVVGFDDDGNAVRELPSLPFETDAEQPEMPLTEAAVVRSVSSKAAH